MTPQPSLFAPLQLSHGPQIKNRFVLAPLTNCQSGEDGVLSEDEYRWLTPRATGGFGLVTTCASHVQADGKGFPGQLGCFSDAHLPGLQRLAAGLRAGGPFPASRSITRASAPSPAWTSSAPPPIPPPAPAP